MLMSLPLFGSVIQNLLRPEDPILFIQIIHLAAHFTAFFRSRSPGSAVPLALRLTAQLHVTGRTPECAVRRLSFAAVMADRILHVHVLLQLNIHCVSERLSKMFSVVFILKKKNFI